MNISTLVLNLTQQLHSVSSSPRLDAELIIGSVLNLSRAAIYAQADSMVNELHVDLISQRIARRLGGEPIAYILGYKEFWTLSLTVSEATLIPRPETELLVEWLLAQLPKELPLKIADLGTGSGAIALSLASERPNWQITATDISASALAIAQTNAKHYGLTNIQFKLGRWCEALNQHDYAAIISNPPYIAADDPHLEALQAEPICALVAAEQGLADLKAISHCAHNYLAVDGIIALEHGYNQSAAVRHLLEPHYHTVNSHLDYNQLWRFTTAIKAK